MVHQRTLIRKAMAAQILAAQTPAGDRVFPSRIVPYRKRDLPAIAVYTKTEPVDPDSHATAPRELTRNLQLVVEASAESKEDLDDALDELCLGIERAIDGDPMLGGTASDAVLANTEIVFDDRGEAPIGVAVMTYAVMYRTLVPDPADLILDDLKTVDVKTSLGDVAPGNQAEDKVTGLESA